MEILNLRSLKDNNVGSIIPILWFIITIFSVGAIYTLFFIEIGVPTFSSWIPASDSKTFILMMFFAMPLFILLVGAVALVKAGLKREVM
jgi:hypothetical protein